MYTHICICTHTYVYAHICIICILYKYNNSMSPKAMANSCRHLIQPSSPSKTKKSPTKLILDIFLL